MCTVSVIPIGVAGFRLVCNRDESRRRAAAMPPQWRQVPGAVGRAIWPEDPESRGTWIAASEAGLCLSLLNVWEHAGAGGRGARSRGEIIPALIGCASAPGAIAALREVSLGAYGPFRLIAVHQDPGTPFSIFEARWNGRHLSTEPHPTGPRCFVSSGLGDARAAPRLDLFDRTVAAQGATPELQDRFHRHRWPDRPEISVLMSRADARTVSITAITVRAGAPASMQYESEPTPSGD